MVTLRAAAIAALEVVEPGKITVVDGKPLTTPPGMYVVVLAGPNTSRPHRRGTRGHWVDDELWLMCVGWTMDGAEWVRDRIRDALQGRVLLDGSTPLQEPAGARGRPFTDGPDGSARYQIPLTFTTYTPRSRTP